MNLRWLVPVLLGVLLLGFWFRRNNVPSAGQNDHAGAAGSAAGEIAPSLPANHLGSPVDPTNQDARFTRFQDGTVYWNSAITLSRTLHQEGQDPMADLEVIDRLLTDYRLAFKANPVGTDNEEIVAALAGENPKKVFFLDPLLLVNGELLDRWGKPYRFHAVSAQVMELRSHGPDGELWTIDDVELKPED